MSRFTAITLWAKWRLRPRRAAPSASARIRCRMFRHPQGGVDLPVIGMITKSVYEDSDVYITPTMAEVDALAEVGVEIIALDATDRPRRTGAAGQLLKADWRVPRSASWRTAPVGVRAAIGFDLVGTTLCGYTEKTRGTAIPNYALLEPGVAHEAFGAGDRRGRRLGARPVAEGVRLPVHAAVVGTAIARPRRHHAPVRRGDLMSVLLGIDIGGTAVKAGLVDETGAILLSETRGR